MTGSAFEAMDVVYRVPEAASERISRKIYSFQQRGESEGGEGRAGSDSTEGWRMTGSAFEAMDVLYTKGGVSNGRRSGGGGVPYPTGPVAGG